MILQLAVSAALVALCSWAGWSITDIYKRRERLYEDLKLFCQGAKNDISFFQLKLADTFGKSAQTGGKDIRKLSAVCVESIGNCRGRLVERSDIESLGLLDPPDAELLERFFNALGKTDSATQSGQISAFEKIFEEKAASAKAETKSKGMLFRRLGPFVGLLLAVLCA